MEKNGAVRKPRGCSPWAYMGCGCGTLAIIGIALVFLLLMLRHANELKDPHWNQAAYADCQQRLKLIGSALKSYEKDHQGKLPAKLEELIPRYLDSTKDLRCPLADSLKVKEYEYLPDCAADAASESLAPLVRCVNHGQGKLVLLRNYKMRLPN